MPRASLETALQILTLNQRTSLTPQLLLDSHVLGSVLQHMKEQLRRAAALPATVSSQTPTCLLPPSVMRVVLTASGGAPDRGTQAPQGTCGVSKPPYLSCYVTEVNCVSFGGDQQPALLTLAPYLPHHLLLL